MSRGVTALPLESRMGISPAVRVFITGVEEGLLPHRNSMDDPDAVEEERRLFYVGMTRAKEKLSLVSAYRRRTYNSWQANRPSRFLTEIPAQHFEPVRQELGDAIEPARDINGLENLLLLGRRDVHEAGDQIGQGRRGGDALDGIHQLGRGLR